MLRPPRPEPIRHLVPAVAIACYGLLFYWFLQSRSPQGFEWANHDVANTLYVGRSLLEGQRLYLDVLEINPPTIFLLAAGVVRICSALKISAILGYHGLVLLMGAAGTLVIEKACRHASALSATLLGLAYLLIAIGCGAPGTRELVYAFGQREHLFVLVFVPYLVWRLVEANNGVAVTLGAFLVGVASSQKPHLAALAFCFEFVIAARAQGTRKGLWVALAWGTGFPYALLAWLCPASIVALWKAVVPIHTGGMYAAFNGTFADYTASDEHTWLCVYLAILAYFAWPLWRNPRLHRKWRLSIVLLLPLAYASVIQQRKFWAYHSIPMLGLSLTFAGYLASVLVPLLARRRGVPMLGLILVAAAMEAGAALVGRIELLGEWRAGAGEGAELLKLVPWLQNRRRVLYFSTSIEHMRLAEHLNQRIIGRFCHNFDYPALVHQNDPNRRERGLVDYCAQQAELIRSTRPEAIVFAPSNQALRSTDPTLHDLLVLRCHVLSESDYEAMTIAGLPGAFVYLRK